MRKESRRRWLGVLAATCGLLAAGAVAGADEASGRTAAEVFEQLKALEGDWVAAESGPMVDKGGLVSRYRVTAAGTALVETEFPGTDHEMVTVYHLDGDSLVLVHYCMAGNQPRMRATSFEGGKIHFAFDGGGNLDDPEHQRHMHSAWIELVGPNEVKSEWTEMADGEPALVVPVHIVRKDT